MTEKIKIEIPYDDFMKITNAMQKGLDPDLEIVCEPDMHPIYANDETLHPMMVGMDGVYHFYLVLNF